jgi:hypothetical protein
MSRLGWTHLGQLGRSVEYAPPSMTKAELETKHLAELHALAAEAGIPRFRMLRRADLIEKLSGEGAPAAERREAAAGSRADSRERRGSQAQREPRRRRGRRGGQGERGERPERGEPSGRRQKPDRERDERREKPRAERPPAKREEPGEAGQRPGRPRRRRRRRFGRRRRELRLADLVAQGAPGRQTIVYAETREACAALLRELAVELARDSKGPDPVAVLVDPGPEELAEWRREAPGAEIVAAAQARHAEDALAQAARRAEGGEAVVVLVDSLTRLAELGNASDARALLDARGSLDVVAAIESR